MRSRRSARPPQGQTCRRRDRSTRPLPTAGRGDPPRPSDPSGRPGRGAAAHTDRAPLVDPDQPVSTAPVGADVAGRSDPLGREERAEERTAFVGSHAVGHGQLMVEPGVGAEVVERAARSSARVARAEDEPADPGGNERARTHGARFEGDDHGDVGQSPIPDDGRRVAQHQHLGVCGRVARALALVVTRRHQPPIDERDGTHGYLALVAPQGAPRRGRAPWRLHRSGVSGCRR